MIRLTVSLVLSVSLGVPLSGCISRDWHAGGVKRFQVTDAEDRHVPEFLLLRYQYEERAHLFKDPEDDNWLPPKLTHLALFPGDAGEITEDGYVTIRAIGLIPQTAIVKRMCHGYRIYADGLEVHRVRLDVPAETDEYRFTLRPQNDVIPEAPRGSRGEALGAIVTGNTQVAAERIIEDVEDDNLWSQVKTRWAKGQDKRAIRYLCKYYLDRFHGIRTASPKWMPSQRCLSRIAWLETVVASGDGAHSEN